MNESTVKNKNGHMINGAGWMKIDVGNEADLQYAKSIINPSLGNQHFPLQHIEAMEMFRGEVQKRGYASGSENMLISPNTVKSVYSLDIADNAIPGTVWSIGFGNYNDKKRAFKVIMGERVMVCSNGSFYGGDVNEKQRHVKSASVNLITKINLGLDQFDVFRTNRLTEINRMKNASLTDRGLADIALGMLRNGSELGGYQFIGDVMHEFENSSYVYEDTDPRSAWALFNAYTHIAKPLSPVKRLTTDTLVEKIINSVVLV